MQHQREHLETMLELENEILWLSSQHAAGIRMSSSKVHRRHASFTSGLALPAAPTTAAQHTDAGKMAETSSEF